MRIYLAGPDVFEPNPKELAEKLKAVCQKFGLEGVFPMDAELALEGLESLVSKRVASSTPTLISSVAVRGFWPI